MICLYNRWRISTALDSSDPAAKLPRRHLARCAACREFYARSQQMAALLRAEPTPAGLAVRPPGAAAPVHRNWQRAAGLAAACIATAILLPRLLSPAPSDLRVATHPPTPVPTAPSLSAFSPDQLLAQAESLAQPATQPILDQIERAQAQILSAGRSLVSCLPVTVFQQSPQPDPSPTQPPSSSS